MGKNTDALLTDLMKTIKEGNAKLEKKMDELRNEISEKIEKALERLDCVELNQKQLEERIAELEKSLDADKRKRNVIIYNLNEGDFDQVATIINFFNENLKLDVGKTEIDHFFRLGKSTSSPKSRPLLVKFTTECRKRECLRNSYHLAQSNIFVAPDLNKQARELRRKLVHYQKAERAKGQVVKIRGTKLIINNIPHTLEQLQNIYDSKPVPEEKSISTTSPTEQPSKRARNSSD